VALQHLEQDPRVLHQYGTRGGIQAAQLPGTPRAHRDYSRHSRAAVQGDNEY
jgi:hypothetical protein